MPPPFFSELKQAVQYALEIGASNADALRLIIEHQQEEPEAVFCLDGRPHTKVVRIPKTGQGQFDGQPCLTSIV